MKALLLLTVTLLLFSCSMHNKMRFVRVKQVKTEKSQIQAKVVEDEAKSAKQITATKEIETPAVIEATEADQEEKHISPPAPINETLTDESLSIELDTRNEIYQAKNVSSQSKANTSDSQSSQRMSDLSRVLLIILFTIAALGLLFLVLLLAFLVGWNSGDLIAILIIIAGLAIIVALYIYAIRLIS